MFLGHFLYLLREGGELRFQCVDGGLFLGEVAGDYEGGRDQLSGVFLFADG